MDKLLEILKNNKPGVDFTQTGLVEEGILDSFDILQIIASVSDEFNVEIPASEIIPENFDSVEAIWKMIQDLQE